MSPSDWHIKGSRVVRGAGGSGGSALPGVMLLMDYASIASGAYWYPQFTAPSAPGTWDTDGFWSSGDPGKLIVPTGLAGHYQVMAVLPFNTAPFTPTGGWVITTINVSPGASFHTDYVKYTQWDQFKNNSKAPDFYWWHGYLADGDAWSIYSRNNLDVAMGTVADSNYPTLSLTRIGP